MIVLEVTADTANKLLAYLGSRPYIESADLIKLVLSSKQVEKGEPSEQPAAPQENGSEERQPEAAAGSAS